MMAGFDSLLEEIGEFGLYQKKKYFLFCLVSLTVGTGIITVIHAVAGPSHRCAIPGYNNDTYGIQDDYHRYLINRTIPSTTTHGQVMYDPCNVFSSSGNNVSRGNWSGVAMETEITKCHRWVYDKTYYQSTAVSEMGLVCDRRPWRMHVNIVFMVGRFFGVIALNFIADLYGRKRTLVISVFIGVVSGFGMAWAPERISLCFAAFGLGVFTMGAYPAAFIIGMEFTGQKKRYIAGTVLDFFYVIGACLVAAVGYLFRDRNITVTILTIPTALLLPCLWVVPESPRWLIKQGRIREARSLLQEMAKTNKRDLPEEITEALVENKAPQESLLIIFKSWGAMWRIMIMLLNWFTVSLLHYGLTLVSIDNIGNPYLNLLLVCAMDIPAFACDIILLKFAGRRTVVCMAMCLGGLACVSTVFPVLYGGSGKANAILALQLFGKFCAAMTFTTIYTFTSELLPTVIRGRGIGACSTFARIGGVMAPYMALSGSYVDGPLGKVLPVLIFGSITTIVGLLNILLPETRNRPLPETMKDFTGSLSRNTCTCSQERRKL